MFSAFPKAKIVGAEFSQEKLKFVQAVEKYHYLSTDSNDLQKANEQLKEEGIELFNVDGDQSAHAILCIVDDTLILGTSHKLTKHQKLSYYYYINLFDYLKLINTCPNFVFLFQYHCTV